MICYTFPHVCAPYISVSIDVVQWVCTSGHYTCPPSYAYQLVASRKWLFNTFKVTIQHFPANEVLEKMKFCYCQGALGAPFEQLFFFESIPQSDQTMKRSDHPTVKWSNHEMFEMFMAMYKSWNDRMDHEMMEHEMIEMLVAIWRLISFCPIYVLLLSSTVSQPQVGFVACNCSKYFWGVKPCFATEQTAEIDWVTQSQAVKQVVVTCKISVGHFLLHTWISKISRQSSYSCSLSFIFFFWFYVDKMDVSRYSLPHWEPGKGRAF